MITGNVLHLRPKIRLMVRDAQGQGLEIEFVLDTGFTGFLTLPFAAITALSLPFTQYYLAKLADDSVTRMEVYGATVLWDGEERDVDVLASDGAPLLGMSLLKGSEVYFQATDGGLVTIEPLVAV
jgi:clan AA aspartic protease